MKLLFKAQSIIERDALRAQLQAAGIASESPARDMSRKVTNSTVDLALDGYSAMFDGFSVLVNESDEAAAKKVLADFMASAKDNDSANEPTRHWHRFYFCSIFSLVFPGLMSLPATYHLVKAMLVREPVSSKFKLAGGMFLFVIGWSLVIALVQYTDLFHF